MSKKLPPQVLVISSDEITMNNICNAIELGLFNTGRLYGFDNIVKIIAMKEPHIIIVNIEEKNNKQINIISDIRNNIKLSKLPIVLIASDNINLSSFASDNLIKVLQKPFYNNDLISIIKNLLRQSQPIFQDKIIKYRDVSMNLLTYKVSRKNKEINLGPTEFKILQLFLKAPKMIFSRKQIIEYVWGMNKDIDLRTVDVHVNRLRNIMKISSIEQPLIKTVRASGYCLQLPGEIE